MNAYLNVRRLFILPFLCLCIFLVPPWLLLMVIAFLSYKIVRYCCDCDKQKRHFHPINWTLNGHHVIWIIRTNGQITTSLGIPSNLVKTLYLLPRQSFDRIWIMLSMSTPYIRWPSKSGPVIHISIDDCHRWKCSTGGKTNKPILRTIVIKMRYMRHIRSSYSKRSLLDIASTVRSFIAHTNKHTKKPSRQEQKILRRHIALVRYWLLSIRQTGTTSQYLWQKIVFHIAEHFCHASASLEHTEIRYARDLSVTNRPVELTAEQIVCGRNATNLQCAAFCVCTCVCVLENTRLPFFVVSLAGK